MRYIFVFSCILLFGYKYSYGQDCLNNAYRSWWDVQNYKYQINLGIDEQKITGKGSIISIITDVPNDTLQIDLQEPLTINHISSNKVSIEKFIRSGNKYYVIGDFKNLKINDTFGLLIEYQGNPKEAKNAPWEGGFIYKKDKNGNPWVGVACQSIGASVWLPCKDYHGDEPNNGVLLQLVHPNNLKLISNGKLLSEINNNENYTRTVHEVKSPINLYNITFYLGDYVSWTDTIQTLSGALPIQYFSLRENELIAKHHFKEVPKTLATFEKLYGPYPFYNDGFKIVEAPYLGMEHQSAIAYGNEYQMGYLGKDRSQSGAGLLFDFIIVHEIAHEWFGNSMTASLPAYAWIQEGFTSYAEVQYIEHNYGKDTAMQYFIGKNKLIKNDYPLIDTNNLCNNLTTDQYDKGSTIVHMMRLQINDDILFQQIIKKMLSKYHKQVVSSDSIEDFFIRESGAINTKFFDQYLRTNQIPKLVIEKNKNSYSLHFKNVIHKFEMALPIVDNKGNITMINITENKTKLNLEINAATKKLWSQYLIEIEG